MKKNESSAIIIDVREPEEFANGHVEGAINIPPSELLGGASKLAGVPKNSKIIVYCLSGSRSNVAKNILESLGFTNVVNGINKYHVESRILN